MEKNQQKGHEKEREVMMVGTRLAVIGGGIVRESCASSCASSCAHPPIGTFNFYSIYHSILPI